MLLIYCMQQIIELLKHTNNYTQLSHRKLFSFNTFAMNKMHKLLSAAKRNMTCNQRLVDKLEDAEALKIFVKLYESLNIQG